MTEPGRPWTDPVGELSAFRDLQARLARPFDGFPYPEGRPCAVLGGKGTGKSSLLQVFPKWLESAPAENSLTPVPVKLEYPKPREGEAPVPLKVFLIDLIRPNIAVPFHPCSCPPLN